HLTNPEHEKKSSRQNAIWSALNDILVDCFDPFLSVKWLNEDFGRLDELKEKYGNIRITSPDLRPSNEFYGVIFKMVQEAAKGKARGSGKLSKIEHIEQTITMLKGDFGITLLKKFHEHINGSLTRCTACDVIVGSADDLYEHLQSVFHVNK
ncbi:hypothetical protein PFISCL1PPCAC_26158, partial [Pristionchus fissidentatus]